jgi:hypothetical protein
MIAIQLQQEEKQRAERHQRRHEALLQQMLASEMNQQVMEE